ncbi:hypothetical protein [Bradyrhizobium sp. SRS-191]|uniref:hypothetical protein n=1 Tax=Bradyrhizobium sp. SRS-191 TaxID=2962606 RepID=UPI00211E0617|nr:hypothetical protein [Bradyrhizobium sp. SRS-191]
MAASDRSARDRADERFRCGRESAWSRHPDADAKPAGMMIPPVTVANKPDTEESAP